jgi:hypothetical protein
MSHLTSPNSAQRRHVASEQAFPASSHLPGSLNLERSFPLKKHLVNPKKGSVREHFRQRIQSLSELWSGRLFCHCTYYGAENI